MAKPEKKFQQGCVSVAVFANEFKTSSGMAVDLQRSDMAGVEGLAELEEN